MGKQDKRKKPLVRVISTRLRHFKNVDCGKIDYTGCRSARWNAIHYEGDITGIYGQNGSGKTALTGLEKNTGLRDQYLAMTTLGSQKEQLYEKVKPGEIQDAFRKVGLSS